MRTVAARRLAWGIWVLAMATYLATFVHGSLRTQGWLSDPGNTLTAITSTVFILAFATVGALVASRRPENPIGWLMIATGLCFVVPSAVGELGASAQGISEWLGSWIWALGLALAISFTLLLFPDGHLPSRRWRPVAWLAAVSIIMFLVGSMLVPGRIEETPSVNPFGIGGELGRAVFGGMRAIGEFLFLAAALLSLASLVFRYRGADRSQREQLRWLMFAVVPIALGLLSSAFIGAIVHDPETAANISNALASLSASAIPIAIGIAILRYRLYDIDVVLNKTVVYGGLAAFITVVYVAIVVGVGSLVGRGGDPNAALSILATAVVAVAFQPVRERVQRLANGLVYGKRATPYQVLSAFSDRLGGTYDTVDLLPRMARILAEGTGAARTDVWLADGAELRTEATWPPDAPGLPVLHADPFPEGFIPIRHQGTLLGALSLEKRAGESASATEQKLVEDLAAQAGLVLRNVRLIEELRASRQRLVAAQDEERRKIERNLHDGAQQQLVALAVQLKLAERLVGKDPDKERELLATLASQASAAVDELRDLARGIYPPLLADKGLASALDAQARKAAVPTEVKADGVGRYAQEVETAVYFCALEALNNVAKYAEASRAVISLSATDHHLTVTVSDDGSGFDPDAAGYGSGLQGMADRLDAIRGELRIESEEGKGTTITGTVPVGARERAG